MQSDVIVERHSIGDFPSQLPFVDRIVVKKGSVEDWHALKSLHYKAGDSFGAASYYRCELDGNLIGVVVIVYPQLLLAERHIMFPKMAPNVETKLSNTYRGKMVTKRWFGTISRCVLDTMYRGCGISYQMINLACRMHDREVIEIKSAMSKYNPFAMKAGFKFVKPPAPQKRRDAIKAFSLYIESDPTDVDAVMAEVSNFNPSLRERTRKALIDVYFKHSSRDKAGKNNKKRVQDFYATMTIEEVVAGLQDLCFSTALYGAYRNPDYGNVYLPKELPLEAFYWQEINEPLNMSRYKEWRKEKSK